jgi:hypothetical protein
MRDKSLATEMFKEGSVDMSLAIALDNEGPFWIMHTEIMSLDICDQSLAVMPVSEVKS